jgi:hypothetical protein
VAQHVVLLTSLLRLPQPAVLLLLPRNPLHVVQPVALPISLLRSRLLAVLPAVPEIRSNFPVRLR